MKSNSKSARTVIIMVVVALVSALLVVGIVSAQNQTTEQTASVTAAVNEVTVSAPSPQVATDDLMAASSGTAKISMNNATGVVRFATFSQGLAGFTMETSGKVAAESQADAFLAEYGAAFGINDAAAELVHMDTTIDQHGFTHVNYVQVNDSVDVFASAMKVHFNAAGQLTAVNGIAVPNIKTSPEPKLDAQEAGSLAQAEVAAQLTGATLRMADSGAISYNFAPVNSTLYFYHTGLLQRIVGDVRLVYEVEISNGNDVREFVYVDAHNGEVINQITGNYDALDRRIHLDTFANPAVWTEGDPLPYVGGSPIETKEINGLITYTEQIYNFFDYGFSWTSWDDLDTEMPTRWGNIGSCPNAFAGGGVASFCAGVASDETVGHEWGHNYTNGTHNLIYQWQSGALNESYSDIWGEYIDLINGMDEFSTPSDTVAGSRTACSRYGNGSPTDDDNYRWVLGEDDWAFNPFYNPPDRGSIRDMYDPTCFGDPGKVTDQTMYVCDGNVDGGGVHTNSGIPNHAFQLLVDGGSYNGQTIAGIDLIKAGHIYWRAQEIYQHSATDFPDHADSLAASCQDLKNAATDLNDPLTGLPSGEVIIQTDCDELDKVIAAVELYTEPTFCNFQPMLDPNAPALCEGLGAVNTLHHETWESVVTGTLPAGWVVGTHDVANPPTFDTPDWTIVDNLPGGGSPVAGSTQAAFVADLLGGDCVADDESGVLYLDSPVITYTASMTVPRVAFDHWVATENGWDGGNLKVSVNGGSWQLVPASNYDFNSYSGTLETAGAGNTNPLQGEVAFTGTDGGSNAGSWGQSQVNLNGLVAPGDSVQFRFDLGIDGCNGAVGWYVDDVQAYSCEAEGPNADCGNGVLDVGETCDDANTDNGDGCSDICQVESGWTCEDPVAGSPDGTNTVADWSFEGGTPNADWNEASTNFGTPLCDAGGCGVGGGTGPYEGDWWTWFGGIDAVEAGSVDQNIIIPATAMTLTFWLEIPTATTSGVMDVKIDGTSIFSVTEADAATYTPYTRVDLPVAAYADGGSHNLRFEGSNVPGGTLNFFVDAIFLGDNVPIVGTPSVCTPIGGGTTFCSAPGAAIPDNVPSGMTDSIVVPDDLAIMDINVILDTSHTWVGDLVYTLEHVDTGTIATVVDRPGYAGSGFGCSGNDIDATIDDEGVSGDAESMCDDAPALHDDIVGGDPADNTLLSVYDAESTSGTWQLTVSDNAGGDTGTLNEWCIEVTAAQPVCSTPNVAIPDNDPSGTSDTITIPDNFNLSDLDVYVDTSHTWVGDLIYTLEHIDTGTQVTLVDRAGYSGSGFGCSGDDIDATIDDEGMSGDAESMCDDAPALHDDIVGGDPANTSLLAVFDGELFAGDWTLTVSDNAGGDTGTLNEWCLIPSAGAGGGTPEIVVDPTSMASTQAPDSTVMQTLTISNTGGADLDWTINEDGTGVWMLTSPASRVATVHNSTKAPITIGDSGFAPSGLDAGEWTMPQNANHFPDALMTLTHSASQAIAAGSVACPSDNDAYLRVFNLDDFGIVSDFDVTEVSFGIETAVAGAAGQPITVTLYTMIPTDTLVYANLTPVGSASMTVMTETLTILTVPVTGTVSAGSALVVEVFAADFANESTFFIGSNNDGQTAPGYLSSAACGAAEPTEIGSLGFPDMHMVMNVTGDGELAPPNACEAYSDISWASTNPTSGTTGSLSSTDVDVTFDSTGMMTGVYTGTLCIDSNDPVTPLVEVPLTMTVEVGTFYTYLPIIMKPGQVDLVVDSINMEADTLEVVITNNGTAATTTGFWVDLYIDPTTPPSGVNQTWATNGGEGLAWGVDISLAVGESMTLTLTSDYYESSESNFSGTILLGATVYAQVDAVGEISYGAILESDEGNNIMGPLTAPVTVTPPTALSNMTVSEGLRALRP